MMREKIYLGLDAHARNCVLAGMSETGDYLSTYRFRTSENELRKHVGAVAAKEKILAVEESAIANWIAQTIRPLVSQILISNPKETPLISRSVNKSDKQDARNLCRLLRLGELKEVYHPQEDHRAVFKAAVQEYLDLRRLEVKAKQKIKAKYRGWGVVEVEGQEIYHVQKRYAYLKQIREIAISQQLERLYELLDTTGSLRKNALLTAKQLSRRYWEICEFRKIPGVGWIGSLVFSAYVQIPYRFTRKQGLWRYAQLAVTDRTSDNKPLGYKRLDKNGNSQLKAMSYHAFLGAMKTKGPNEVKQYYQSSLSRVHDRRHARLNTQRKILSVMHGIWRKKEAYQPQLFLTNP